MKYPNFIPKIQTYKLTIFNLTKNDALIIIISKKKIKDLVFE